MLKFNFKKMMVRGFFGTVGAGLLHAPGRAARRDGAPEGLDSDPPRSASRARSLRQHGGRQNQAGAGGRAPDAIGSQRERVLQYRRVQRKRAGLFASAR